MNLNVHMTRAERVQRIGAILSKGVSLMLLREAEAKRKAELIPAAAVAVQQADRVSDGDDTPSAIIKYIDRVGSASPRDVQRGLSLPKTTAFRHLDSLTKAGIISRIGKTAAVRYQLAVQLPIASS
jgi:uncharacterized membrane protein